MLHWLARARAALVPPAARPGAVLVTWLRGGPARAACRRARLPLVGVDLTRSALVQAAGHGVTAVQGDATALPLADGCADVVCAGEILEHVLDLRAAVREACRVFAPAACWSSTPWPPPSWPAACHHGGRADSRRGTTGLHDPALFVDRKVLATECARHGSGSS